MRSSTRVPYCPHPMSTISAHCTTSNEKQHSTHLGSQDGRHVELLGRCEPSPRGRTHLGLRQLRAGDASVPWPTPDSDRVDWPPDLSQPFSAAFSLATRCVTAARRARPNLGQKREVEAPLSREARHAQVCARAAPTPAEVKLGQSNRLAGPRRARTRQRAQPKGPTKHAQEEARQEIRNRWSTLDIEGPWYLDAPPVSPFPSTSLPATPALPHTRLLHPQRPPPHSILSSCHHHQLNLYGVTNDRTQKPGD